MINVNLDLNGCDNVCEKIEELTSLEISFDAFITGSISMPDK
jgi:hypothetical protein